MLWWIKILLNTLYIYCVLNGGIGLPASTDIERENTLDRMLAHLRLTKVHCLACFLGRTEMPSRATAFSKKNLRCHCSIDLILIVL